ncbi:MAG: DUF6428 family protein [Crocinitomicaceae bacterium]
MKLYEIKNHLIAMKTIEFELPTGKKVPAHFHVTEVGKITKHFIDCGGTERKEEVVNFQLWEANDYDHRLHPEKLLKIIQFSEAKLNIGDVDIELEYQGESIIKYGVELKGQTFHLTSLHTDCLAKDSCGVSVEKQKINLIELQPSSNSCTPGGGCC